MPVSHSLVHYTCHSLTYSCALHMPQSHIFLCTTHATVSHILVHYTCHSLTYSCALHMPQSHIFLCTTHATVSHILVHYTCHSLTYSCALHMPQSHIFLCTTHATVSHILVHYTCHNLTYSCALHMPQSQSVQKLRTESVATWFDRLEFMCRVQRDRGPILWGMYRNTYCIAWPQNHHSNYHSHSPLLTTLLVMCILEKILPLHKFHFPHPIYVL